MKKLVLFAGLLIIVPMIGMDLITQQDNRYFAERIQEGLEYDKKKIAENKLSEHNPLHVILKKTDSSFAECGNDLSALIKKQSLGYRLNDYMKIDNEQIMQPILQQIKQKQGNIEEVRENVIKKRKELALLLLHKKQTNFKHHSINEERLDFMLDNQYYPTNEAAFNDYLAMAIYWYILAKK